MESATNSTRRKRGKRRARAPTYGFNTTINPHPAEGEDFSEGELVAHEQPAAKKLGVGNALSGVGSEVEGAAPETGESGTRIAAETRLEKKNAAIMSLLRKAKNEKEAAETAAAQAVALMHEAIDETEKFSNLLDLELEKTAQLQEAISKKDGVIITKDQAIAKQHHTLANQEATIARQHKAITDRNHMILEQDKVIAQKDAMLAGFCHAGVQTQLLHPLVNAAYDQISKSYRSVNLSGPTVNEAATDAERKALEDNVLLRVINDNAAAIIAKLSLEVAQLKEELVKGREACESLSK